MTFCFRTFTDAYYPRNRKHTQSINVGYNLDQTICIGIIIQCEVNEQNHNFVINSFPQKMISPHFLRPVARTQQTFRSLPDSELFSSVTCSYKYC